MNAKILALRRSCPRVRPLLTPDRGTNSKYAYHDVGFERIKCSTWSHGWSMALLVILALFFCPPSRLLSVHLIKDTPLRLSATKCFQSHMMNCQRMSLACGRDWKRSFQPTTRTVTAAKWWLRRETLGPEIPRREMYTIRVQAIWSEDGESCELRREESFYPLRINWFILHEVWWRSRQLIIFL